MRRARQRADPFPRIWTHRTIGGELRRVLRECLALSAVAVPGDVHRARLALKRARAVLRLAGACGLGFATAQRRLLAQHARQLGSMRDQAVVAELARDWAAKVRGVERRCAFAIAENATVELPVINWVNWIAWLTEERERLASETWSVIGRRQLQRALAKAVRRVRKTHIVGTGEASAEELHEWRKAVIVLREQLYVLGPLLSRPQRRLPQRLHELSRRLGAVGDCRMVISAAAAIRVPFEASAGRGPLIVRAQERRDKAIREAARLWLALKPALRRRLI